MSRTFLDRFAKAAGVLAILAIGLMGRPLQLRAQEQGPMQGPPPQEEPVPRPQIPSHSSEAAPLPRGTQHSSSGISKTPPSIPVDQIVQKFAEREAEFKEERGNFTYSQDFTVQEIDDNGHASGEFTMASDVTFTPSGKRFETVTYAPPSTLQRISLSEQDLDDLKNVQPFVLTTEELPKYDINYVGREKIDDVGTYVFDVAPKKIEKNQRYFQGRIWVDDKDLEIVKTDGKAVPDIRKGGNENVFPRFETYRENIESHYWFPTFTYADDTLHFHTGDVHIRMVVHYSDYKRFRTSARIRNADSPAPSEQPQQ